MKIFLKLLCSLFVSRTQIYSVFCTEKPNLEIMVSLKSLFFKPITRVFYIRDKQEFANF